jgi:DNA-binding NarL/FixJ family response regulator
MHDPLILIVEEVGTTHELLKQVCGLWNVQVHSIIDPCRVIESVRSFSYNLILVDARLHGSSSLELITELRALTCKSKIIIMASSDDKMIGIEALKRGAYHILEKPITLDMLSHTLQHALKTQAIELEYNKLLEELELSQKDLIGSKTRLKQLSADLEEANKALAALARHISFVERHIAREEREELEKEVDMIIQFSILPLIEELRRNANLSQHYAQLDMLASCVRGLTTHSNASHQSIAQLTSSELRIASFIKRGMTSDEIAAELNISLDTVKTHRKNIRKKLKINGAKNRLTTYLQAMEAPGAFANGADLGHEMDDLDNLAR